MSSKTIVIERPSSGVNRNFPYLIVSDNGKVLTAIKNGQQGKVALPANASYEQAKLMWCTSKKLNVTQLNDNATIELTQNNFLNARMPLVVSAFPLAFLLSGVWYNREIHSANRALRNTRPVGSNPHHLERQVVEIGGEMIKKFKFLITYQ